MRTLSLPPTVPASATLLSLKARPGDRVQSGTILATYGVRGTKEAGEGCGGRKQKEEVEEEEKEGPAISIMPFKSTTVGKVCAVLHEEGDFLQPK